MKNVKLSVTLLSLFIGCVSLSYADDPRWGSTEEDPSMRSNTSYDSSNRMDMNEEMDYDDMLMSAEQAQGYDDNMERHNSLRGYCHGESTDPSGQRGRHMEE